MCGKNNTIIKFDVLHIATNVHKGHLYYISNVTTATEVISARLFVGKWHPTLYYVAISFHRRELSRAFSVLCTYSKFGHHPHPLRYLCAKFRFFGNLHC